MKLYDVQVDVTQRDLARRIIVNEYEIVKETEKMWAVPNGSGVKRYHKEDEDIIKRVYNSRVRFRFYTLDMSIGNKLIETGINEGIYQLNTDVKAIQTSKEQLLSLLTELEESK